uniref:7TM_GPCR_Srx domain-containing protein n=1 Tax=Globodera pallida TaxID=36090 RepID=A0A183CNU0_GLOPA
MRLHSRIVLQICFVDIVLTVLMEIVQPIYIIDAGIFITYLNGPLMQNIASPTWRFLFYDAWLFGYVFALWGLCTQFVYRYFLLVREWRVSLFSYFLMLSLAFFCTFIFCCICYFPDDEAVPLAISAKIKVVLINLFSRLCHRHFQDAWTIFTFFCCVAMNLVANTIIVFCGYRMYRHVQQKTKQYTDELKRLEVLNKQMTRTLVALVGHELFCVFLLLY